MTESEAFERLRRENRRWKGVALGACSVVVLITIAWLVDGTASRLRSEARANRALADVEALIHKPADAVWFVEGGGEPTSSYPAPS
jgi:hypothetical protein